ncbi:NTP pyrophosphohydrolase [Actinopolymorpha singaporensis]|uniref:YacP-like NYN domain-containing protein n=1 Tax=Actinopolymorpha singaporensis TaxID=117157 RepID=A0A1H1LTC1_9ACTN|nr:NTP pyrophosphohydrolase [Actinopolymorpha singaporensis]SDR77864.1 hypothetical protein SAMN04489717_0523 [Actinopolymorpha singaporensis]
MSGDLPPLVVVDAANVMGSVPDGWWRDRSGAAGRVRDALGDVAAAGLPGVVDPPVEVVLVTEGAARDVAGTPTVRVVPARGSGDDAIVDLVRSSEPDVRRVVVVTADRGLRTRVRALGAEVVGPRTVYPPHLPGPG